MELALLSVQPTLSNCILTLLWGTLVQSLGVRIFLSLGVHIFLCLGVQVYLSLVVLTNSIFVYVQPYMYGLTQVFYGILKDNTGG